MPLPQPLRSLPADARFYLLGTFLTSATQFLFFAQRNLYFRQAGWREGEIGQVLGAMMFGTVLATLPSIYLLNRLPLRTVLPICSVLSTIGCVGQVADLSRPMIYASSLLQGFAQAMIFLAAAPFFMRVTKPEKRTELFHLHMAVLMAGGFLSSLGSGFLIQAAGAAAGSELAGYRQVLSAGALLALASAIPFRKMRSPPAKETVESDSSARRPWKLLAGFTIPEFLIGLGAGASMHFQNLFLVDLGAGPEQVGAVFAGLRLMNVVTFLTMPKITRRHGLLEALVWVHLLSFPFLGIMMGTSMLGLAIAAVLLRQAMMNAGLPLYSNLSMELTPEPFRQWIHGFARLGWHAGMTLGSIGGGILIEAHGFPPAFGISMALYAVATLLIWIWFRGTTTGKSEPIVPYLNSPELRR
jgi:predicted MFS family arabinose efflux permease